MRQRILVMAVAWDTALYRTMEVDVPANELIQEVRDRLAGELDPLISEGVLPAMDAVGFKRCTFAPEPEMVTADAIMLMRIAVNRDNGIYFELNLVSSEYHTIAPLGVDA